jgi:hypothetical protein
MEEGLVIERSHTCDYDEYPCEACDLRQQYAQEDADTAMAEREEAEEQERGE